MVSRLIAESIEYQEGYIAAEAVDSNTTKLHNPYIAGTTSWQRWNIGWNTYAKKRRIGEKQNANNR